MQGPFKGIVLGQKIYIPLTVYERFVDGGLANGASISDTTSIYQPKILSYIIGKILKPKFHHCRASHLLHHVGLWFVLNTILLLELYSLALVIRCSYQIYIDDRFLVVQIKPTYNKTESLLGTLG